MPFKDPERGREYQRSYYAKHREERLRYQNLYNGGHREQCRKNTRKRYVMHREEYLETNRRWKREHPHRLWAINSINSHRRGGFTINMSLTELEYYAKHTRYCYVCGRELFYYGKQNESTACLDRIDNNDKEIAIGKTQIICTSCSSSKGDKTMAEWLPIRLAAAKIIYHLYRCDAPLGTIMPRQLNVKWWRERKRG